MTTTSNDDSGPLPFDPEYQLIPEGRTTDIMKCIRDRIDRIVRVVYRYCNMSTNRLDNSDKRGMNFTLFGTGCLLDSAKREENKLCPCAGCCESDDPKMEYFKVCIATAKNVVIDDSEAKHSTVEFVYDSGDRSEVFKCDVVEVLFDYLQRDYTILVTHDMNYNMTQYDTLFLIKIVDSDNLYLPIMVSHPHGAPKRLSIGTFFSFVEIPTDKPFAFKVQPVYKCRLSKNHGTKSLNSFQPLVGSKTPRQPGVWYRISRQGMTMLCEPKMCWFVWSFQHGQYLVQDKTFVFGNENDPKSFPDVELQVDWDQCEVLLGLMRIILMFVEQTIVPEESKASDNESIPIKGKGEDGGCGNNTFFLMLLPNVLSLNHPLSLPSTHLDSLLKGSGCINKTLMRATIAVQQTIRFEVFVTSQSSSLSLDLDSLSVHCFLYGNSFERGIPKTITNPRGIKAIEARPEEHGTEGTQHFDLYKATEMNPNNSKSNECKKGFISVDSETVDRCENLHDIKKFYEKNNDLKNVAIPSDESFEENILDDAIKDSVDLCFNSATKSQDNLKRGILVSHPHSAKQVNHFELRNSFDMKRSLRALLNQLPGNRYTSLCVYPVFTNRSVHSLMRYELLRIQSYNKCKSTIPVHSPSQLAQFGFYFSWQDEYVTCFNCEASHQRFMSNIALDSNAHDLNCENQRRERNIPLFKGTAGLTASDLTPFSSNYGSDQDHGYLTGSLPPASSPNLQRRHSSTQVSEPEPTDYNHVYFVYTSAAKKDPTRFNPLSKAWTCSVEGNDILYVGALSSNLVNDDFLDLRGAAYPVFANQRTRRDTFHSWDPTHTQKPDDLVNLGFFYAGYSDCARCFYCGLGLKYWRANDNAAYQHARFRPHCKYNQFVKGQDFVDQVQREIAAGNQGNEQNASTSNDIVEVPNMNELMRSDVVRQALEEGWSEQELRAGVSKLVRDLGEECLMHSILVDVLANNQREASKHPNNAPAGAPVSQSREMHDGGSDNGDNALQRGRRTQPESDANNAINTSATAYLNGATGGTPAPANMDPEVVLRLLEREHEYLKKRLYCMVCHNSKIGCIYLPCGHVVACQPCGDLASTCVLCGKVISAMANIFMS